jgi:hypothetical protein
VRSDSSGVARADGLPTGRVEIAARANGSVLARDAFVTLNAGESTETTLQLVTGAVLHVRVLDRKGAAIGDDPEPPDIAVLGHGGFDWDAEPVAWGSGTARDFGPLPEGEYDVRVWFGGREGRARTRISGSAAQEIAVVLPD